MKKILLLALIGLCFLAPSCKKKYCWTCTTTIDTTSRWGKVYFPQTNEAICDKTEAAIREFESDASFSLDAGNGVTLNKNVKCIKDENTVSSSTSSSGGGTSSSGSGCATVQCSGTTKSGARCKNKTTNCSGRCYLH